MESAAELQEEDLCRLFESESEGESPSLKCMDANAKVSRKGTQGSAFTHSFLLINVLLLGAAVLSSGLFVLNRRHGVALLVFGCGPQKVQLDAASHVIHLPWSLFFR